ncbi:MAG TPA: tripartite tricarboxylate transporter substrate-binding protein [Ramlibacter sp.]|nr:tripartite tricarboxylate transporter substrate-binding protein [Ramlibacter sp.]
MALVARFLAGLVALTALCVPLAAPAQTWPERPIRLVVPFAAGGGSDLLARTLAEPLSQRLGQPVVVDNKPGANAVIGADLVAKAPADGYTVLYTPPGPQITNPSLMARLPYDPVKDLLGGRVQMTIDTLAALLPHIRSGAVRPIAIAALERAPSLPDLPTLAETLEGFDASSLSYLSVRAGTPAPIVERLNREVNAVLALPAVRARLLELGILPGPGSQAAIARQVESERHKWKKVIDAAGLKAE